EARIVQDLHAMNANNKRLIDEMLMERTRLLDNRAALQAEMANTRAENERLRRVLEAAKERVAADEPLALGGKWDVGRSKASHDNRRAALNDAAPAKEV